MGSRLERRLLSSFVLAVCLGLGAAREAAAQQASEASWSSRNLARACWFGGSRRRCATEVARVWDSFAKTALVAIQPNRADSVIVRDGMFVHPDAPAFYTLRGLLLPVSGNSSLCMEVRADRQQLASLTCAASRQLGADGNERWPEENTEFLTLRQRLVDAGCLPPPPQDPCALAAPNVAALSPPPDDLETDSADESPSQVLVNLQ